MSRILYIIALLTSTTLYAADQSYPFPVLDVVRSYTGSFGEMRSNHLHSGVDIRTDGVVGKGVVAIDDGYISRISLSSGGFGLALYVAHSNGTTSVYAHLDSINETFEEYLQSERYQLKQHSVNLYPAKDMFRVKRGEQIGRAGNSGSSSGPHLHFEVRNSKLQKPLNPVKMGIITPNDHIAPTLEMLYYVEVDDSKGVERSQIQRHPIKKGRDGVYRITRTKEMWVGRRGYFVLASADRMEGSHSVFGLYSLRCRVDGETIYHYQQDGFTFDMTRYCNALSFYPYQLDSRGEKFQLRRQPALPESLLKTIHNDGIIGVDAGGRKEVEIVAIDHNGNSSTLRFTMRGKGNSDLFRSSKPKPKEVIHYDRESRFKRGDLSVTFAKGSLYRNYEFAASQSREQAKLPKGVEQLSPIYRVLSREIPLHRAMKIEIGCKVPDSLASSALVVFRNHKGECAALKSSYKNGVLEALSSSTGEFFAAIDNEPPTIKLNSHSDNEISFTIEDNFSGVESYSATLDGEWIALERKGSTLTHKYREGRCEGEMELKIEDLSGNKTVYRYGTKTNF